MFILTGEKSSMLFIKHGPYFSDGSHFEPENRPTKPQPKARMKQKRDGKEVQNDLSVTFRNTHPIFADIIRAEIFEPNLSNAIPDTSHIFARSAPFRWFRHFRNLRTASVRYPFDPASEYFVL